MKKIIRKPQVFFLPIALLSLIIGLLNKDDSILVSFYTSYAEISVWSISVFTAVFLILISVNYFSLTLTGKSPKKVLTLLHIIFQTIALIPLFYFCVTADLEKTEVQIIKMNSILLLAFLVFLFASLLHIINFIASLISKKD